MDKPLPSAKATKVEAGDQMRTSEDLATRGEDDDDSLVALSFSSIFWIFALHIYFRFFKFYYIVLPN